MERLQSLQEKLTVRPGSVPVYPDGLSQREVEVLRLIALGRSNPAIAQELFISPNTVAHHVTNILNKTNTANRTEAATYAGQHGLI
jgi:DNA-binding NarL/FixJ family response regulator